MSLFTLVLILVAIGSVLGVLLLMQIYLAKYQNRSLFYWREIRYLNLFIIFIVRHPFLRSIIYCLGVLSYSGLTLKQYLKVIFHFFDFYRLRTLFQKLDDIIDAASPEEILSFGKAHLGHEMCPFIIYIDSLLSKNERYHLNRLTERRLITTQELHAFGNIIASKLSEQAQLTIMYRQETIFEHKILQRQKIAQTNLEVAGCYCVLAIHFIKQDPRILAILLERDTPLTYEDIKAIYPNGTKGSELMQILHDVPEFRSDLEKEHRLKKITPNYFLAVLEKKLCPTMLQNKINPLPSRVINFHELPEEVQNAFLKVQKQWVLDAFALNFFSGWILTLIWEYNYLIGFLAKK